MVNQVCAYALRATFAFIFVTLQVPALAAQLTEEQTRAEFAKLHWQKGPASGAIGDKASIAIPADAGLLPEASGARFLELTGNIPTPGETILANGRWWATLSFKPSGYIKDDEKLDADALLKTIKEQDGPSNERRKELGIPLLHTDGWVVPPHFDPDTKHLEWGLRLRADGVEAPVINYTVRLLGRSGYESVVLVSSPETLQADIGELKAMLKTFNFNAGERYAEFKPGDRVAEFGLGALVVGGAAAAAVKSGLWKSILVFLAASWKLLAGLGVALVAGLGKFFTRKSP